MRDLQEWEVLGLRRAQDTLQNVFSSFGYRLVDPPLLEPTETFARKAGGEFATRMYSFVEPGGHHVTLRPEFTSAVVRLFRERQPSLVLPVRWQYGGPVFRYYPDDLSRPRQFWQVGGELLGASGPHADAEVIAVAASGLTAFSLPGVTIALTDIALVRAFLARYTLSDRAQQFILRNLSTLKEGPASAEPLRDAAAAVGLLRSKQDHEHVRRLIAALNTQPSPRVRNGAAGDAQSLSWQRTPDDIARRLRQKLAGGDDPSVFDQALSLVGRLGQVAGEPAAVLNEVAGLAQAAGVDQRHVQSFSQVIEAVDQHLAKHRKTVHLHVDLSLSPALAYYTGVLFELRADGPNGTVLGSGGRYDGLLKALGAQQDTPAIGFAFSLPAVVTAWQASDARPAARKTPRKLLVVPESPSAYVASLRAAETLRLSGDVVVQALQNRSLNEHESYAASSGFSDLVVVNDRGETKYLSLLGEK